MRTAIDTNVLSALWSREPIAQIASGNLASAKREGGLVISGAVFAELLAHPKATESFVNGFLSETGISIDFDLQPSAWIEAGRRFALYANRRRRSRRGEPRRLLTDFIIGSHALAQADRLMTLDAKPYQRDFPELKLI